MSKEAKLPWPDFANVAVVRSPRIKLDLTADERLVLAMRLFTPADEMHRLAKRAMDNGAAQSRDEAEAMLRGYRVGLSMGPDEAADRHHQAALLTAVALGRRVFLGGVSVEGDLDTPLLTPLSFGATLRDAIVALGGPWAHRPMAPRFS